MADWLDDDKRVHSCNFEHAYTGFEIMMAMCRSVAEGGQVPLPLTAPADEMAMLTKAVGDRAVLFGMAASAKEYPAA